MSFGNLKCEKKTDLRCFFASTGFFRRQYFNAKETPTNEKTELTHKNTLSKSFCYALICCFWLHIFNVFSASLLDAAQVVECMLSMQLSACLACKRHWYRYPAVLFLILGFPICLGHNNESGKWRMLVAKLHGKWDSRFGALKVSKFFRWCSITTLRWSWM